MTNPTFSLIEPHRPSRACLRFPRWHHEGRAGKAGGMSELPAMPMYWSDFFGDTNHLPGLARGAYALLLGNMWLERSGWVPDDDAQLANMCSLTLKEWQSVKPLIRKLLKRKEGRLSQKRLLDEKRKVRRTVK